MLSVQHVSCTKWKYCMKHSMSLTGGWRTQWPDVKKSPHTSSPRKTHLLKASFQSCSQGSKYCECDYGGQEVQNNKICQTNLQMTPSGNGTNFWVRTEVEVSQKVVLMSIELTVMWKDEPLTSQSVDNIINSWMITSSLQCQPRIGLAC